MAKHEKKEEKLNLTVNVSRDYYIYLRKLSHELSIKENGNVGCSTLVRRALEAKYPIPGAQMSFNFDEQV
jgi:hypothetical protein